MSRALGAVRTWRRRLVSVLLDTLIRGRIASSVSVAQDVRKRGVRQFDVGRTQIVAGSGKIVRFGLASLAMRALQTLGADQTDFLATLFT